jgi:archaellum biogenesis ATPase FlaH
MTITEILDTLLKLGPVVSVLISVIYYLQKKLKQSEMTVEKLHKNTRDSEKENIILLDSLSHALDKLTEREDNSTRLVITELRNLRDIILAKLEK